MNNLVNDHDSIITFAPDFQFQSTSSTLPKPFEKLSHLQESISNSSRTESPKSPALVNPHNAAWFESPTDFIGKIPESYILSKCTAFVDVWSSDGLDNRSRVFCRILNRMGATIARKFTKKEDITHLIFKDGHKSYLQKAKKRNIPIVNCFWVEECRVTQSWVDETPYLFDDTNYKPPKKFREIQPLDPEEARIRSAERAKRKEKREEKRNAKRGVGFLSPLVTGDIKDKQCQQRLLACDTPYTSSSCNYFNPLLVSETPNESILRKLQRMREGKPIFSPPSSPVSETSDLSLRITHEESASPSLATKSNVDVIPSSQPSDMDLTCLGLGQIRIKDISNFTREDQEPENSCKSLTSNSESSSFQLHLSNSFNFQGNLSQNVSSKCDKLNSSVSREKALPKRSRRKLYEVDVVKPSSLLISPLNDIESNVQVTPRRSRRLSSAKAAKAISRICSNNFSVKYRDDSTTADSTFSTLPLPGSTLKSVSSKSRFFEPIRSSVSTLNESSVVSDDCQSKRKCPSLSTSFDERNSKRVSNSSESSSPRRRKQSKRKQRNSKKIKKCPRNPSLSSTDNEQKLTEVKQKRKKVKGSKPVKLDKESIIKELMEAPKPRRSTEEFSSPPLTKVTRRSAKHSVLVFTSLHSNERILLEKIVRRLGRFHVQGSVKDQRVSHLICGEARLTLNVLYGLTKGLWLLSKNWLIDSMSAGKWLDEEEYEVDYFPSAKKSRLMRDSKSQWNLPLFKPIKGFVYVSPGTKPPTEELRELITRCGGRIIESPRRAGIRVGQWVATQYSLPAVKESWVLDSIVENILKPIDDYRIT